MAYKEKRLKAIFIGSVCSFIRYLMRVYRAVHEEAILHNLPHYATNLVKIQEASHSPHSSMREDNRSPPGSFMSSRNSIRITTVIAR